MNKINCIEFAILTKTNGCENWQPSLSCKVWIMYIVLSALLTSLPVISGFGLMHSENFCDELCNPKFTIDEIRKAIPIHCFDRNLMKSVYYMVRDLLVVTMLTVVACKVYQYNLNWVLQLIFWPIYTVVQGTFCTALWVVAHECGHSAFSKYDIVNDFFGSILHSALLVPYWSWKYSHALHHLYTNHITKDQTHIPSKYEDVVSFLPITRLGVYISVAKHLLLGWPAYLLFNATGSNPQEDHVNHFNPYSSIFLKKQRLQVILSDIYLMAFLTLLVRISFTYGFLPISLIYFAPYLVVNAWLVFITKMQHHDIRIPYYSNSQHTYVKGQLSTIDRSYGFILNSVLHHINDTHIAHHMFSRIPHYHAKEATEHIKKFVGAYYKSNNASLTSQLWDVFSRCLYVEEKDGTGVWWFKYNKKCD